MRSRAKFVHQPCILVPDDLSPPPPSTPESASAGFSTPRVLRHRSILTFPFFFFLPLFLLTLPASIFGGGAVEMGQPYRRAHDSRPIWDQHTELSPSDRLNYVFDLNLTLEMA
ncbi:hypothetical protein M433DRAFT_375201 [Acidomyces richmondensis BFW]|nr:hypothetical protein M433DRAFT_375201 [Acidomyces richmondensis BFW]